MLALWCEEVGTVEVQNLRGDAVVFDTGIFTLPDAEDWLTTVGLGSTEPWHPTDHGCWGFLVADVAILMRLIA